jgi:hypothetical protein
LNLGLGKIVSMLFVRIIAGSAEDENISLEATLDILFFRQYT